MKDLCSYETVRPPAFTLTQVRFANTMTLILPPQVHPHWSEISSLAASETSYTVRKIGAGSPHSKDSVNGASKGPPVSFDLQYHLGAIKLVFICEDYLT